MLLIYIHIISSVSARFQLENYNVPTQLGLAQNLYSLAWLELKNSSSNSLLVVILKFKKGKFHRIVFSVTLLLKYIIHSNMHLSTYYVLQYFCSLLEKEMICSSTIEIQFPMSFFCERTSKLQCRTIDMKQKYPILNEMVQ